VWHVEGTVGHFGSAGGLLAAAGAIAHCSAADNPTTVVVVAVEKSGVSTVLEVVRR
jgi:hypothetical protein